MKGLKNIRKDRGYSQKELAELIGDGVSQAAISKWENGESVPRKDRLDQLCTILEASAEELTGEEPPTLDTKSETQPEPNLSVEERMLLDLYRGADDAGRKVIMSVADLEYNRRRAELLKE